MPTWREILSFAKEAKERIQNSSMLNPLARGAIKSIPVVGDILLEIWDNSTDSTKNKSKQILETLTIIEKMNENTFQTFSQTMNDNKDEILKNLDKLNQILFETKMFFYMSIFLKIIFSKFKNEISQLTNFHVLKNITNSLFQKHLKLILLFLTIFCFFVTPSKKRSIFFCDWARWGPPDPDPS